MNLFRLRDRVRAAHVSTALIFVAVVSFASGVSAWRNSSGYSTAKPCAAGVVTTTDCVVTEVVPITSSRIIVGTANGNSGPSDHEVISFDPNSHVSDVTLLEQGPLGPGLGAGDAMKVEVWRGQVAAVDQIWYHNNAVNMRGQRIVNSDFTAYTPFQIVFGLACGVVAAYLFVRQRRARRSAAVERRWGAP